MLALFHSECWHFFIPDVGTFSLRILARTPPDKNLPEDVLILFNAITCLFLSSKTRHLLLVFNVDTFLSSIDRLIGKKGLITEYYNSPDSSFVLEEGKTMHKEDQVFLRKIVEIIDANMADPNLTAPVIAEKMGIGIRVLYRRIESLTDKSLRTGHQNPGTFYRNFKNYHGVTTTEYRKNLPIPEYNV